MPNTIIKLEADATGWHDNLRYEAPELKDGWAVVPESEISVLKASGGVVSFTASTAAPSVYPDLVDRRTAGRGTVYPIVTQLAAAPYTPPPSPEPTEPIPTDTEVLNALIGIDEEADP